MNVGKYVWEKAIARPYTVRARVGRVSNEYVAQFATLEEAMECAEHLDRGAIYHAVSGETLWESVE